MIEEHRLGGLSPSVKLEKSILKNQEHEGSSGLGDNENERGQRQARMKKYWVVCSLCTKARGRVLTQAQGSSDSPPPLEKGECFNVRQSQGSILTPPLLKLCDALENHVLCAVLSSINGKLI